MACQAQTVRNIATSHKIDYITQVQDILNLKGYQNCITGSKLLHSLIPERFKKETCFFNSMLRGIGHPRSHSVFQSNYWLKSLGDVKW